MKEIHGWKLSLQWAYTPTANTMKGGTRPGGRDQGRAVGGMEDNEQNRPVRAFQAEEILHSKALHSDLKEGSVWSTDSRRSKDSTGLGCGEALCRSGSGF